MKVRMTKDYPNLSQDDVDCLTAFFQYVDTDDDGFVTPDEINEAMAVDLNGDGVIAADEMVQCGQEWMNTYFRAQDLNADGKISLSEMLAYNNRNTAC